MAIYGRKRSGKISWDGKLNSPKWMHSGRWKRKRSSKGKIYFVAVSKNRRVKAVRFKRKGRMVNRVFKIKHPGRRKRR